jgi:fido (protein-threonine AMPylation protein)
MLGTNFKILEKPWWHSSYSNYYEITSSQLLNDIEYCKKLVKINSPLFPEYFNDFSSLHKILYIKQILNGEDTLSGTDIDIDSLTKIVNDPLDNKRSSIKIKNLSIAFDTFLVDTFFDISSFSTKLLKNVHKIIGKGVIKNVGNYRTLMAKPAQEDWIYLNPSLIENELELLCKEIVAKLLITQLESTRIKLVSGFLVNFLQIHPFSNGNGRVARIATSMLLKVNESISIPLYINADRYTYLQCLRESRQVQVYPYYATPELARFLLESIHHCYWNTCSFLELFD